MIGAIGAGMNQSAMLARFAREGDFDVFLLAGRYTLLDQEALAELLPLCVERGIGDRRRRRDEQRRPGRPAAGQPVQLRAGAAARSSSGPAGSAAVCARHGVPLRAAAIQFPLAHPAVASLVAGVRRVDHLDEYPALMRRPIPADLWAELRAEGLIAPEAPTPADRGAAMIVDAHHHFWDPARADYPWLTDDLAAIRRAVRAGGPGAAARRERASTRTILVQTRSSVAETRGVPRDGSRDARSSAASSAGWT